MYPLAFHFITTRVLLIVLMAVGLEFTRWISDNLLLNAFWQTFAISFIALVAHRALIINEDQNVFGNPKDRDAAKSLPMWRFAFRFMAVFAPFVIGVFAIFFTLLPDHSTGGQDYVVLVVAMLFSGILLLLYLPAIGTMLPAAAVGGDASLKAAFKRAKGTYFPTMGRLLIGPLLISGILLVAFPFGLGLLLRMEWLAQNTLAWRGFGVLSTALHSCSAVLTATALSMAYQKGETMLKVQKEGTH